ncbi:MAG: hypothetical protein RBT20_06230, partial [Syntrophales bacterium]|nr:hypothetical protein [Syntrophales bacterium]
MAEDGKKDGDLQQELESLYEKVASVDPQEDDRKSQPGIAEFEEPEEPELRDPPGRGFRLDDKLRAFWTAPPYPGILICVFLLLGSVGIVLWPSLYHYDAIDPGNGAYPLRVNRLTGEATYYDGGKWTKPPIAAKARKPEPAGLKAPPTAASTPPAPPLEGTAAPSTVSAQPSAAQAPPPAEKQAGARPAPPPAPAARKDIHQAPYAIQIRAFPEARKKEALAFQEKLAKEKPDVFLEIVSLG